MKKINKLHATIAIISLAFLNLFQATAQETHSPYSKFGYGLLNDNATSTQRQMGGVGYAMTSGRQTNVMNPASYAAIDTLTFLFDMGLDMTFLNYKETVGSQENKFNGKGGGLDYITMQFPIGSRLGMSLGILPYSSVGYSFGSAIENGSSSYEGSGNINQLNLGLSGRIWRGLSVGANVSYLFGTLYHDAYAYTGANTSLFEQVMQVRDYHLQFGLQYSQVINRRHRATVGVVYTPAKTLLGHTWVQQYRNISETAPPDTLENSFISLKGNYSLPETWGAGISYEYEGRIFGEVDFTYQPWSKANYTTNEYTGDVRFADRYRVSAGVSYSPRYHGRYIQRVAWRLGAYYNRDYIMVGNNNVRDFGISCGAGLPAPSGKTVINIGLEYINRSATPQPLMKENYFNITLGINFNQTWFFQNKIQ
ncbi:MAG: hypothetical protein J1E84_04320 [Muribaculaceae bacterium]|nr:hypothetical protein [Muribaculaceae bacterium]